jgi:hypothetical protein
MSCKIDAVVIDCRHPERVGRFWAEVLGWGDDPENPNLPGDPEWLLMSPDGTSRLLFQPVPEPKSIKNRLHAAVRPIGQIDVQSSAHGQTSARKGPRQRRGRRNNVTV